MNPRPVIDDIKEDILPLVAERRSGALLALLVDLHPADISHLIAVLGDEEDQRWLFSLLTDPELASDVLTELPSSVREHVVENLHPEELAGLVEEMSSDDAADVVQELSEERQAEVMRGIEAEERREIQPLLAYDEETAGGIMATEVLTVPETATVADAMAIVREHGEDYEPFFFVYVVDAAHRLRGVLSLRDLVMHEPAVAVSEACDREPVSVPPTMDQEEVAHLFRRYDLLAVPVVDETRRLLGRITIDDVVDVMKEEAEEDIARMAGTDEEEFHETSVRRIAAYRLPWILGSLGGGCVAGMLLNHFTSTLAIGLSLVAFVPMIMAMGGNAGSQAAITMVRLMALRRVDRREIARIVWREARVGMLMGITTGTTMGAVAYVWRGAWYYGVIVGVSMAGAILFAATMGTVVPVLFRRFKVDPAIATGPFVTVSNDSTGLLIYFGLATLLLHLVGR